VTVALIPFYSVPVPPSGYYISVKNFKSFVKGVLGGMEILFKRKKAIFQNLSFLLLKTGLTNFFPCPR
jgi:hypothetical protein